MHYRLLLLGAASLCSGVRPKKTTVPAISLLAIAKQIPLPAPSTVIAVDASKYLGRGSVPTR